MENKEYAESLDTILKQIKNEKNPDSLKALLEKFKKHLSGISPDIRGDGPDFSRLPGDGTEGELWFRNKMVWLKTIPLGKGEAFIELHPEASGYYHEKKGKISADILGIWRNEKTTRFAVVELKAGANGDRVFYAIAEGLRNVYLLWQERKKLSILWEECNKKYVKDEKIQNSVWRGCNPFNNLDNKNISLLVIGDDSWSQKQNYVNNVPREIKLNNVNVKIAIYSLNKGGKPRSRPHALLPLKKIL